MSQGTEVFHNIVQSGAQYDVVKARLDTIGKGLQSDPDCLGWLELGQKAYLVADQRMYATIAANNGVASWIEIDGQKTDGIAAQANIVGYDIIVNAAGAFFYGGDVPGLSTAISGKSTEGQILTLLHELAHLTGTLAAGDMSLDAGGKNNAAEWDHCKKTILGK